MGAVGCTVATYQPEILVLLNILIALYNSAYEDITDNADDEFMALFSEKTMQFVRAPDENVFIPRESPALSATNNVSCD